MNWARAAGFFEGVNPVEGVEKGLAKQRDRVAHYGDEPDRRHGYSLKAPQVAEILRSAL